MEQKTLKNDISIDDLRLAFENLSSIAVTTSPWMDLLLTESVNHPKMGYGRYTRLMNGLVLLYIDTFCDTGSHPIAMLPVGYRPITECSFTTYAVDALGDRGGSSVPIKIRIAPDGRIIAHIVSDGMQCHMNVVFVASEQ